MPADEVLELVTDLVEPASWKQPDVYARAVGNRIVIRHTPQVQNKISRFLIQLEYPSMLIGGGRFSGTEFGTSKKIGDQDQTETNAKPMDAK